MKVIDFEEVEPVYGKIGGYLEVGHNMRNEIVINLPDDMTGHIVFSTAQARYLAKKLIERADLIEGIKNGG